MSRWRRIRTVSPARRARVTACRTARMSGPDSRKPSGYRIASSPSCSALSPAARNASAASRTRAHHAGRPAVLLAQPQPRLDRLRPRLRVADRVAAGQAHAHLDAVGDRRAAVRREHRGLVPAGGEVAERVVLAVQLEQAADRRLVLTGERVLRRAATGTARSRRPSTPARRTGREAR